MENLKNKHKSAINLIELAEAFERRLKIQIEYKAKWHPFSIQPIEGVYIEINRLNKALAYIEKRYLKLLKEINNQ